MSVFQDLYDSEINFSVSCFWDGGFLVGLGGGYNDEWEVSGNLDRFGQIEQWLIDAAIEIYPQSMFAEMYRDGLKTWRTDGKPNLYAVPKEPQNEE